MQRILGACYRPQESKPEAFDRTPSQGTNSRKQAEVEETSASAAARPGHKPSPEAVDDVLPLFGHGFAGRWFACLDQYVQFAPQSTDSIPTISFDLKFVVIEARPFSP